MRRAPAARGTERRFRRRQQGGRPARHRGGAVLGGDDTGRPPTSAAGGFAEGSEAGRRARGERRRRHAAQGRAASTPWPARSVCALPGETAATSAGKSKRPMPRGSPSSGSTGASSAPTRGAMLRSVLPSSATTSFNVRVQSARGAYGEGLDEFFSRLMRRLLVPPSGHADVSTRAGRAHGSVTRGAAWGATRGTGHVRHGHARQPKVAGRRGKTLRSIAPRLGALLAPVEPAARRSAPPEPLRLPPLVAAVSPGKAQTLRAGHACSRRSPCAACRLRRSSRARQPQLFQAPSAKPPASTRSVVTPCRRLRGRLRRWRAGRPPCLLRRNLRSRSSGLLVLRPHGRAEAHAQARRAPGLRAGRRGSLCALERPLLLRYAVSVRYFELEKGTHMRRIGAPMVATGALAVGAAPAYAWIHGLPSTPGPRQVTRLPPAVVRRKRQLGQRPGAEETATRLPSRWAARPTPTAATRPPRAAETPTAAAAASPSAIGGRRRVEGQRLFQGRRSVDPEVRRFLPAKQPRAARRATGRRGGNANTGNVQVLNGNSGCRLAEQLGRGRRRRRRHPREEPGRLRRRRRRRERRTVATRSAIRAENRHKSRDHDWAKHAAATMVTARRTTAARAAIRERPAHD